MALSSQPPGSLVGFKLASRRLREEVSRCKKFRGDNVGGSTGLFSAVGVLVLLPGKVDKDVWE